MTFLLLYWVSHMLLVWLLQITYWERNGLIVGMVVFGLGQWEILTHLGQVIKCKFD